MAIGGADGSVTILDVVADAIVGRLQNFKSDVQSLHWARLQGASRDEAARGSGSALAPAGDLSSPFRVWGLYIGTQALYPDVFEPLCQLQRPGASRWSGGMA